MNAGQDLKREREQLLDQWMSKYKNSLMRVCAILLQDQALAEDAVQEAFVKAYLSMDTFRQESSEKTWLMRIAINTCKNMKRNRWFRFVDRRIPVEQLPEQCYELPDLALKEAVGRLPFRYREVIVLYYYQGMTLSEISEALGVGVSTVHGRLKKACMYLHEDLKGGESNA